MTPEQTERRRLYMAEYRKRPGMRAHQLELERARRAKMTPDQRKGKHEQRRQWTQRRRDAGVHTVTLLPQTEYDRLLLAQHGVCAICGRPETAISAKGRVRRLSIDHHHASGTLRALLCSRCNTAIALLQDDPDLAIAAAEYLRRHRVPELSKEAAQRMQEAVG